MEGFNKLCDKIVSLFEVKSIVTLMLISVGCWGFVNKIIGPELFSAWVSSVMTYFFVRKQNN
jgi:hypothetical protein